MNEEWYSNRDKRTDSCIDVNSNYKNAIVHLHVVDDINEYRVQLITYFTLNILARWCRNIVVSILPADCLLEKTDISFETFVGTHVKSINPYCDFKNYSRELPSPNIHIYIGGNPEEELETDFVCINSNGWLSCCAFNKNVHIDGEKFDNHTIGASFAACLGNAEVFRYLVGNKSNSYSKWYSLWNNEVYDYFPQNANGCGIINNNLGRIHLVGCGAIGSSFVFLFPFIQCQADFLLVDPDIVEDHNTSSSLLFVHNDIANSVPKKALICKEYLFNKGIEASPFTDDYSKYEYQHNSTEINTADILLCFANENNIWATIQNLYPPVCLHATTSKSWGIHTGRHIPLKENCLMCTFKDVIKTTFKTECSQVTLSDTDDDANTHTAILPFLASAAAVVTLSELLKLTIQKIDMNNTTIFNMGTSEGCFVSDHQPFGNCFICDKQNKLYHRFGHFSKYWNLSIA